VSNGPIEAVNLIKRIKRIAFGFRRFRSFRIRALLYAGRPNWDLLATITPRSLGHTPMPPRNPGRFTLRTRCRRLTPQLNPCGLWARWIRR